LDAATAALVPDSGTATGAALSAAIVATGGQSFAPIAQRGLRNFHTALGRRNDAPVRVLGIGHSFMEGQGATANGKRWWERFQQVMRQRFPLYDGSAPSGRGFLPAFYKAATMTSPTTAGGTVTQVNNMGPGGRTLYIPATRSVTFQLVGTKARVWYVKGPSLGDLLVNIDGADQTAVPTANATQTDGNWAEFSLGAGAHTVKVTAQTNAVYVAGCEEFNGNELKGFQFNEAAHAGFTLDQMLAVQIAGGGDIDQLWNFPTPDLVIVEFGINELVGGSITPSQFQTSLGNLYGRIRTNAPYASILYVADYQDLGSYTYQWQDFVSQYATRAAGDVDSTLLDMTKRFPAATTTAPGLGLSVSDGHPSDYGHMAYAQYIADFITPR
jgi:hypothetical protein